MNSIQFFADKNCSKRDNSTNGVHGPTSTDLFELKTWLVDIGNGRNEWCGSLHNVSNGERHYFNSWSGLATTLQDILTPFAQLEVMRALLPMEEVTYWIWMVALFIVSKSKDFAIRWKEIKMLKNLKIQMFGTVMLIFSAALVTLSAISLPTPAPVNLSWPSRPDFSQLTGKEIIPVTENAAGLALYHRSEWSAFQENQNGLNMYHQSERAKAYPAKSNEKGLAQYHQSEHGAFKIADTMAIYHQSEWFGKWELLWNSSRKINPGIEQSAAVNHTAVDV